MFLSLAVSSPRPCVSTGPSRFFLLHIDIGRQQRMPHLERCDMCDLGVGDEHHFGFPCEALTPVWEC
eukprot:jgi/Botrbrau1/901/Bobra.0167s0022.1